MTTSFSNIYHDTCIIIFIQKLLLDRLVTQHLFSYSAFPYYCTPYFTLFKFTRSPYTTTLSQCRRILGASLMAMAFEGISIMQSIRKCMLHHSLTATKDLFFKLSKKHLWHCGNQRKAVNSIIKLTFHTCYFLMTVHNKVALFLCPLFMSLPKVFFFASPSNRH